MNLSHNAMPKGGEIGRKQSVLKKNCQKRKSKFKGVQKQKKVPMELARNAATEITFVGEDDVVSEQIPPPAASASLRKIGAEYTESSSDESIDPKGEIPEGYRLVSMDSLKEFARRIHSNSQCVPVRSSFSVIFTFAILIVYIVKRAYIVAFLVRRRHHLVIFFIVVVVGHLELREISTSRFGLSSSIYAICDDCGLTEFLGTGEHNSLGPRTVQGKDVNRRVVYAASEMGIGTLSSRLYTQKCK